MGCMEYFNFLRRKSQFGRSNESPWSHTLTLRGHETFSNCFVVSGVVPGGGGVLPYITYTGMCRPKGS